MGMSMHPESPDSDSAHRSVVGDVFQRQEPDEEEDEGNGNDDGDDGGDDDGYSE